MKNKSNEPSVLTELEVIKNTHLTVALGKKTDRRNKGSRERIVEENTREKVEVICVARNLIDYFEF